MQALVKCPYKVAPHTLKGSGELNLHSNDYQSCVVSVMPVGGKAGSQGRIY